MNAYHSLLDAIKNHIRDNEPLINQVRLGPITEIDQAKTSQLAICQFDVNQVRTIRGALNFQVIFMFADIVDKPKKLDADDQFYGATNLHDVYNEMLVAATRLKDSFRRGNLYDQGFQLVDEEVNMESFKNRFENELAGWMMVLTISTPNELSIC